MRKREEDVTPLLHFDQNIPSLDSIIESKLFAVVNPITANLNNVAIPFPMPTIKYLTIKHSNSIKPAISPMIWSIIFANILFSIKFLLCFIWNILPYKRM